MSKNMLFCTATNHDDIKYIRRVMFWYSFIKDIDADLFCFSDGKIREELKNSFDNRINFIDIEPYLGHRTHAGWKRSIREALKVGMDYDHIMHIENDVAVFNTKRIYDFMTSGELHAGWASDCNFMQTAIMSLNDKKINNAIIKFYSKESNLYSTEVTEQRIQSFGRWKYDIVGDNYGLVMYKNTIKDKINAVKQLNVDYWGQFFSGYRFNNCSDNFGFVFEGY